MQLRKSYVPSIDVGTTGGTGRLGTYFACFSGNKLNVFGGQMVGRVVLALGLLLASGKISAETREQCADMVGDFETTLTPHQLELLGRLRGTHYSYQVLVKGSGESLRTVVLLGDVHHAAQPHEELSRALQDSFERVGIEGATDKGYYFNGLFDRLWRGFEEYAESIGKPRAGALNTARVEKNMPVFEEVVTAYVQSRAAELRAGTLTADALAAEVARLVDEGYFVQAEQEVREGRKPQFTQKFTQRLSEQTSLNLKPQQASKYIELEEGHRLSQREKTAALMLLLAHYLEEYRHPLQVGVLITVLAQCYPPFYSNAGFGVTMGMAVLTSTSLALMRAATKHFANVALHRRNPVMATNILRVFKERPQMTSFLAIAGRKHLPGIADILKKDGWRAVPKQF